MMVAARFRADRNITDINTMIRRGLAGFAVLLGFVAWLAHAGPSTAGTLTEEKLASQLLGRDYHYTLYRPDGQAEDQRRYPVLYLLHGASGDEFDWPVKGKVVATLDRLIAEHRIPPFVVVMPGHKGMWWVDGHAEPAESVLLKELMPEVERRFNTRTDRAGRAIAGLSAGGFATIRLIFQHPDLFAAAAAMSPAIYEPTPPATSSAMKDPTFRKDGAFDAELWKSLNWRSLFDAYKAQPLTVPLYINAGDRDQFDIAYHAAVFHRELRAHQPNDTVFRVVDGTHEWAVWRRTIGEALEYMGHHVAGPQSEAAQN